MKVINTPFLLKEKQLVYYYKYIIKLRKMLQTKSFKVSDDSGINELLKKFRLAPGANILVSDGYMNVPFEDGLPMNVSQKRVDLLESKYKLEAEVHVINRGQKVLLNKINGVRDQFNSLQSDLKEIETKQNSPEVHKAKQGVKEEIKRLDNVMQQYEVSLVNGQAEMTNKVEEIKVYEEEIKGLEGMSDDAPVPMIAPTPPKEK